jgi:hypothetical protein
MYKIFRFFSFFNQILDTITSGLARFSVITQNPVTGRMSGNIANTRFGVWRGINVAASIGLKEQRKTQELSTAVILNRAKMKLAGHTMIGMVPYAKYIFPVELIGTTAFSSILSYFRKKLTGIVSAIVLDITQIVNGIIGNGLPFTTPFTTTGGGLMLNVTYNQALLNTHFSGLANIVFLVVDSKFTKFKYYDIAQTITAGAGGVPLDLSLDFLATDEVMCYVGLYENDAFTDNVMRRSKFVAFDVITWIPLQ